MAASKCGSACDKRLRQDRWRPSSAATSWSCPRGDQIVFDEGYGDNWQRGFVANADIDDAAGAQVYAGSLAQELAAAAFTIEYKPRQAVDSVGYRALRLAIHPGDADGGARPAFNIMVNGDTPSLVQLIGGDIAGLGLDLDRGE